MKASATENVGYCDLKHHETWFVAKYSELLDQRKEAKLQWLLSQSKKMEII
jgi:hypothetical protein